LGNEAAALLPFREHKAFRREHHFVRRSQIYMAGDQGRTEAPASPLDEPRVHADAHLRHIITGAYAAHSELTTSALC
jgi:hypothetical protein